MLGDAEFIADTLLIEKVIKLNTALSTDLKKEAQLSSVLSGAASQVKSAVGNLLDTSSTGSFLKSVLKMMEPAIFFKIHPLLGILDVIAQSFFNISLTGILSSIVSKIAPTITSGQKVTAKQINEAGASLIPRTASHDLLEDLKVIEKKGELTKIAFLGNFIGDNSRGGAIAFPRKGTSLLHKVFGFLGQGRGSKLLVGFLVWFLKTALLGAGMLAIGGVATKALGYGKEEESTNKKEIDPEKAPPPTRAPATPMNHLKPSGWGTGYFKNDANNAWVVPLKGSKPKDILLDWFGWIYPDLVKYESELVRMPSFTRTLRLFRQNYVPSSGSLIIPPGFNRPIDVVNQFAGDINRYIQQRNK